MRHFGLAIAAAAIGSSGGAAFSDTGAADEREQAEDPLSLPLPLWQNHSVPTLDRTNDLIARLTLDEKASLLGADSAAVPRLGLPAYSWGRECERGDCSGPTGTAYPTELALAASFDVQLVNDIARATALEVRGNVNAAAAEEEAATATTPAERLDPPASRNSNRSSSSGSRSNTFGASCFGPVSNLIRDSRWGRTAEMLTGEDPQLGRILSRSFTWGMQAPPLQKPEGGKKVGDAGYRMLITIAKHLNTYAGPEGWGFTFGCVNLALPCAWACPFARVRACVRACVRVCVRACVRASRTLLLLLLHTSFPIQSFVLWTWCLQHAFVGRMHNVLTSKLC